VVTEVGRQPWTVVGYLLTRDAVTTSGNLWLFFAATLVLYAAVGAATVYVLRLLRDRWRARGDVDVGDVPYGPSRARDAAAGDTAAGDTAVGPA
jgi:cytochrome d ubiquinol oxidase subunit I